MLHWRRWNILKYVSNHFVLQALCHPLHRLWDWVFSICKFKNIFWPHSIFFWRCSNIFDRAQICKLQGKILLFYHDQKTLTVFKTCWTCSKKFELGKNIFWTSRWNRHKCEFKLKKMLTPLCLRLCVYQWNCTRTVFCALEWSSNRITSDRNLSIVINPD